MEDKSPAEKAWRTMKGKSSGIKAAYTRSRRRGAKKAAAKVKSKQWEPEKIEFLKELKANTIPNICAVCNDNRPFVLQIHHVDPEKRVEVVLCANCHDTVRRGTLEDLRKAHKGEDKRIITLTRNFI